MYWAPKRANLVGTYEVNGDILRLFFKLGGLDWGTPMSDTIVLNGGAIRYNEILVSGRENRYHKSCGTSPLAPPSSAAMSGHTAGRRAWPAQACNLVPKAFGLSNAARSAAR